MPSGKQVFLEHLLHRFEIEVGAQIHDREIFLVELMDRVGLFEIARDPVFEHVDEGFGVTLGVHAHEGGKLQEAGIDPPAAALQPRRHDADHFLAKPFDRLFIGEIVDLGRRDARIDRARHQRQAGRLMIGAFLRHDRGRRERRDGGLADGDDMRIRPHMPDEIDQMLGVVVESESVPPPGGMIARVDPVGDIDLVIAQHRLQRAAQQRREMARHRRDEQDFGFVGAGRFAEPPQVAEIGR